jgi:hypothetical protein
MRAKCERSQQRSHHRSLHQYRMKNAEEFGERSQQRSHHRSLHQYRMKNVEEFGERSHIICDRSHMQQTLVSPRVRTIADRSQPIVRFIRNLSNRRFQLYQFSKESPVSFLLIWKDPNCLRIYFVNISKLEEHSYSCQHNHPAVNLNLFSKKATCIVNALG